MMAAQFVPVVLMLFCTIILPESPAWCLNTGRIEKAINVFTKIYPELNPDEARQIFNARNLKRGVTESHKSGINLAYIIKTPVLRYGLIIGCMVAILQQFNGAAIVMYYAPVILQSGDVTKETLLFQTIFIGLLNAIGAFVGMNLFDKYGRRPVMKIGTAGCILGLLLISWSMYTHNSGYLSIGSALFFMVMFAISWGSGCWVLISEIFPPRIKGYAMGMAITLMWVFNFLVTQFFPMINEITYLKESFNGAFAMWVFAGLNMFCFFFLHRYVPETKGIALDDIESLIENHIQNLTGKSSKPDAVDHSFTDTFMR